MHLEAHLQNMHLWRGMEVTDGFVLTTDLSVTDKKEHFRAGLWGGTNQNGSYKEFDYYLSYTWRRFNIAVWDIYNFSPGAEYNNEEFFNYKSKETGCFIDATLSYTLSERYPLHLSWSTILYGRDRDEQNGKNRYSTFIYVEYPVWKSDKWEVSPGMGGAFALSSGKDANGYSTSRHFYGTSAGIVHLSLVTTYQLFAFKKTFPVTVLALWNPQNNKGFLQIGVRLLSL